MYVKMWSDVCVLCLTVICITVIRSTAAEIKELKPPSAHFSRHSIVQPVVLHGRSKREISTTRDGSVAHHTEVTMKVPIDGEEFVLDLRLNQDLVTDNHVLSYQKNGKTVVHKPKKEELDLCHYGGSVRDKPDSWVAVSTCHGVQGIVFDGERMRYIEPAQGEGVNGKHYVYASTDLSRGLPRTFHPGITNSSYADLGKKTLSRHKRYASQSEIRAPYNANKNSRYVELVMVADRGMYEEYQGNIRKIRHQMKTLANIVNALYSQLNIFVALVGVEVWNDRDQIQIEADSLRTLENFVKYRGTTLVKNIPNDSAHLITTRDFNFGVLGKAHTETICSRLKSGGIESYYTDVIGLLATAVAHEMGHNLGMHHDDEVANCECRDKRCIMSSTSHKKLIPVWSTCSLNSLAYAFSKGMDYCLKNKPERLFGSSTCGNGFVEPGEQCDCGSKAVPGTYNPCHACCDPNTCMLRANATCGAGMCCDLQTCRPKSSSTVCRSADRECDLPEYCTGQSEYCPDDVYKMDTTPCGGGGQSAYCMQGECRSHSVQCRLLWGPTGKSSHDKCYAHNTQGDNHGDCGYDFVEDRYSPCHQSDVMCGRLQCNHLSESSDNVNHLQFGSGSPYTSLYQDGHTIGPCYTVAIDLSVKDVGLVPDGAKCGEEMMCLNQRCLSVSTVRETMAISVCPYNCSGHGVCDSAGQCQCEPGYEPPTCTPRRRDNSNTPGSDYNRPVVKSTTQKPTVHNYNRPGTTTNSQHPTRPENRRNYKPTVFNNNKSEIKTTPKPNTYNNNIPVIGPNYGNPNTFNNNRLDTRPDYRNTNTFNNNRIDTRPDYQNPNTFNNNRPSIRADSRNPNTINNNRLDTITDNRNPTVLNNNKPAIKTTTPTPYIYNNNIPVIGPNYRNPNIFNNNRIDTRPDYRNPNTFNNIKPAIKTPTPKPNMYNNNIPVIGPNYRNPNTVNNNSPDTRPDYRNTNTFNNNRLDVTPDYRNPTTFNNNRLDTRPDYRNSNTFNNNKPDTRPDYRNTNTFNNNRLDVTPDYRNPTTFNNNRLDTRPDYRNRNPVNNNKPGIRPDNRIPNTVKNNSRDTKPDYRNPNTFNNNRLDVTPDYRNPNTFNNNRLDVTPDYRNPTTFHNNRLGTRPDYRNPNTFNNNRSDTRPDYRNRNTDNYNPTIRPYYRNTNTFNNNRPDYRNPNTYNNNRPGTRPDNRNPNNSGRPGNYRNPKQSPSREPYLETSRTDSSNGMVVLYVFLGIIPLILLVLFLIYHFRTNLFKQYKDFQRKLSTKSNTPGKRNIKPITDSPMYVNSTDLPGPIYANNDRIKTRETPKSNNCVPEEVIQKICAANDISKVFDAKQLANQVVKPKCSPPPPPAVKPKPKIEMHVSKGNKTTSEAKDAEVKPSLKTVGAKHWMCHIESTRHIIIAKYKIKPKIELNVSRETKTTSEVKDAELKPSMKTVDAKHRMYNIESSSLYKNIARNKVNYSQID